MTLRLLQSEKIFGRWSMRRINIVLLLQVKLR